MSNVLGSELTCGDRNEYVEVYNRGTDTVDLATYRIWDLDPAPADEICPWTNDSILIKYPSVRINSTLIGPASYALILDREYCSPDTAGGNWQLYAIPDSTLIVTTDETTICDGLAGNDALILYSVVECCTTSFGTPFDSLDNFPVDPGDGISWERIALDLPDHASNWHPSIDTAGCTPGRPNSVSNAFDLAIDTQSIHFVPAVAMAGEDVRIDIVVSNLGLSGTDEYRLIIFDDQNGDSTMNSGETVADLAGIWVGAQSSVMHSYTCEHPAQGSHLLGFTVEYADDVNPANNRAFKVLIVTGEIGELALMPPVFTPDNDGINDLLQIDYRLPEVPGRLTISVFDTRGIRIFDVCRDEPWTVEQGTLYWDGRSSRGDLPRGIYIIYLEYQYHDRVTRAKKTAVLGR